ncbi:hypothetical protein [Streptomyces niveus]|uniref:hypothetical protein n=1 Tax=Streptomyces niveus TaxID=193462 RepID=UPI0036D20BF6
MKQDTDAVLAAIPDSYRKRMISYGYEPVSAWTEQRFTDIVLNHGGDAIATDGPDRLTVALRL